ncbi:FeoA family protein [Permianibacter fluminis]|uniref:FeoA family protein n=1 Tax=Permianibacter fluminis TaxID=2738515 RepID=UPI001B7D8C74|nr:FeoA family protein [Permianibacter fluminis]
MSSPAANLAPVLPLSAAVAGQAYQVIALTSDSAHVELSNRLAELGFLPGERVLILARGVPGGEPLAVRVGLSTFALRRAEADCVQVVSINSGGGH